MKSKLNLVLIGAFFALVCLFIGLEASGLKTGRQKRKLEGMVLPELVELDAKDVSRIEIEGSGKSIVLERSGARTWSMREPMHALADGVAASNLLQTLQTLRPAAGVDPIKGKPTDFGLAPPERTLKIYTKSSESPVAELEVGKLDSDQRFVQTGGEPTIQVVDAKLLAGLFLSASQWRERSVFQLSTFSIKELDVAGLGRKLSARRDQGDWLLTSPIKAPADPQKIEGILADLVGLQVASGEKGFVATDVKDWTKYGLDKPVVRIELVAAGEDQPEPQVLEVGGRVGESERLAYARRAGRDEAFVIDFSKIQDLGLGSESLRSHRLASLNPDLVYFLDIQLKDSEIALERGREGWSIIAPNFSSADAQSVGALVEKLSNVQIAQFLKPSEVKDAGLDPPSVRIRAWQLDRTPREAKKPKTAEAKQDESKGKRVVVPSDPPRLAISFGSRDAFKKILYAKPDGEPSIVTLPDSLVEALPSSALSLRDHTMVLQSPVSIQKIAVTKNGKTSVIEAPRSVGNRVAWAMTSPIRTAGDPQNIMRLVPTIANLRAEHLVSEAPDDVQPFGLRPPWLSVNWKLKPSPKPPNADPLESTPEDYTLIVGKQAPGKSGERYAMVSGSSLLFTLNANVCAILSAELKDRQLFAIEPSQVDRITFKWPRQAITLSRLITSSGIAGDWASDVPAKGWPAQSRIQKLVLSFTRLVAAQFDQYEGEFPKQSGLNPPALTIEVHVRGESANRVLKLGTLSPGGLIQATTDRGNSGSIAELAGSDWMEWLRPPEIAELPENVFGP